MTTEATASPTPSFHGKSVLVTGAGSGIGLATVEAFARAGATVIACDFQPDALAVIERVLEPQGLSVYYVEADIRLDDDVQAMMAEITERFGLADLDIAINNAGIEGVRGPLDAVEMEGASGVLDTINTNLLGTIRCMREQLRVMRPRGTGLIINIASVFGSRGAPNAGAYSATKHGIVGLTRSTAMAEAASGIRIISVSPGAVDTPILRRTLGEHYDTLEKRSPMKRYAQPSDVAKAITALAQSDVAYLNGADIKIDGAQFAH